MKTEKLIKAINNNENTNVIITSLLSDIVDEVEITKGAMILDGYDEEDTCIHYMNGLIKELKNIGRTYMVFKECRKPL